MNEVPQQEAAPLAPAPTPKSSPAAILACVLAGGLGLLVIVHAILGAQRELREDEKVEILDLDEKSPLELEADRLREETERLQREKEQLQKENLQLIERFEALSKQAPAMPLIETFVASAEGERVIGLAVGTVDKVEKGFQFAITRDKKVIARVVADVIGERACACRVLVVTDGESIRVGDEASTRLH